MGDVVWKENNHSLCSDRRINLSDGRNENSQRIGRILARQEGNARIFREGPFPPQKPHCTANPEGNEIKDWLCMIFSVHLQLLQQRHSITSLREVFVILLKWLSDTKGCFDRKKGEHILRHNTAKMSIWALCHVNE